MTTPHDPGKTDDPLADSERQASRTHPENFKEAETDQKVVEVLPIDRKGDAIKGIDPEK